LVDGRKLTVTILWTARPHSSGWRALITKTSMTMSTVPGMMSDGRLGDVMSHTDAWIVPTGGEVYRRSF